MKNETAVSLRVLPAISAVYYGLLQTGYDYYGFERDEQHVARVESFMGVGPALPFFETARQQTCRVYPYWPRAAILEEASLYLDAKRRFADFDGFRNRILSASNIAPEEKEKDLWAWLSGFPAALGEVLDSPGFRRYMAWERECVKEQRRACAGQLEKLDGFLGLCRERYGAALPAVTVALSPVKCVYASDHYLHGDSFLFTSGGLRLDSVVHECLHTAVRPVIAAEAFPLEGKRFSGLDESYYLDGSAAGYRNAFEEYAVRALTDAVLRGDAPLNLTEYLIGLAS